MQQCLISGCGRIAGSSMRGLCAQCYKRAKQKVENGETTWEKLARMKLCEGKSDPFDDAYSRAMEGM